VNRDFRDMLSALCDAGVEFLIVGAYALAAHGLPRATGDIDIWLRPSAANAKRVLAALAAFGAPLFDLIEPDLVAPGTVFQIGVPPHRIDLLTSISGVEFDAAWSERIEVDVDGLTLSILGKEHLIANKRAAGRPKDLVDAEWLDRAAE